MNAHPLSLEQRMCGAKKRHLTKELAAREKQAAKDRSGDTVSIYRCPYCHYFHVGRKRVYD